MKKGVVYVGLSGGVDSSVAALLLQEAGYTVVGVFIKVWQPDFLPCTWKEERYSALRVAATLGIPFLTVDLEREYKQEIIDELVAGYTRGETPNPDVLCNEKIKFGAFAEYAFRNGATHIATGHYASLVFENGGVPHLMRPRDLEKDQTYFLSRVPKDVLARTLFPLGPFTKDEVRRKAAHAGLSTATKKDSQGLCFLGKLDMKDFLKEFVVTRPGKVITQEGEEIGEHDGALLYTEGERHGFRITASRYQGQPLFVHSKNVVDNTLTVSPRRVSAEAARVALRALSDIAEGAVVPGVKLEALFRYRQKPVSVEVQERVGSDALLSVPEGTELAPLGQVSALYRGNECVGGGVVTRGSTF